MHAARFKSAPPAGLSGDDLSKWNRAVEAYRAFVGDRSPVFDAELIRINSELSKASAATTPRSIPAAAARALEAAMPLYRAAQWEEDDRANRFWIAVAEPMLASAAEELADAHAKAYGVPFPRHILVDVSAFAGEFGGYTVGEGDYAHTVVSSTHPLFQGFRALEMLMHEPSHAIADEAPTAAVGSDLTRVAKELKVTPRRNLWHAILFYTSGELTRRALARRGVTDYKPVITLRYDGPFRGLRQSLETHWQAHLDGKLSSEAAIRRILMETTPAKD